MDSSKEKRLERARAELQSAYTMLQQIQPSNDSLERYKLELWRVKSRLELAILLMKLAADINYEERRPTTILRAEAKTILEKAKEMVFEALKNSQNINITLEKVRAARDFLQLLETGVKS